MPVGKKTTEKTKEIKEIIAPHLPKEVRQKGKGDLTEQKWFLKLFLLAVVFGFASGIVGGMVINSRFFDNWLWGEGGAWKPTASQVRRSENRNMTQDTLTRKIMAGTVTFYAALAKSAGKTMVDPTQKIGRGVVLTADGYIATTKSVLAKINKNDATVIDNNRNFYRIEKIIPDPASDLVIVKVSGANLATLSFADIDEFSVGTDLWLPAGDLNVQSARVLSINYFVPKNKADYYFASESIYRLGLTDLSLDKSFLGAPLVNNRGELAGLLVGGGTFLKSEIINSAMNDILVKGNISRAYLGARGIENSQLLGTKNKSAWGVTLSADPIRRLPALDKKSPLLELGMKADDVIVSAAGEAITPLRTLPEILITYAPGSQIEIKYLRNSDEKTALVVLGELR